MWLRLIVAASAVAVAGCATTSAPTAEANATMLSNDGRELGTLKLVKKDDGYLLTGHLTGLSPGLHGLHLHAIGLCDAPAFTSAGSHLNPGLNEHGSMNPKGQHLGDLPNIVVSSSGVAEIAVELRGNRNDLNRDLFDSDGTAIVIHNGADDYRTDPSGNSGTRVSCGILIHS